MTWPSPFQHTGLHGTVATVSLASDLLWMLVSVGTHTHTLPTVSGFMGSAVEELTGEALLWCSHPPTLLRSQRWVGDMEGWM